MKRITVLALGIVLLFLQPAFSLDVVGNMSNFDVWNYSGYQTNDFEIFLEGIAPDQITSVYTGDYPDYLLEDLGNGTRITWTGSTTAIGAKSHFGVTIEGNSNMSVNPSNVEMSWTVNGTIVDNIPVADQIWQLWGEPVVDIIRNTSTSRVWVQRRINTTTEPISLDDLLITSILWDTAMLVDPDPVILEPGVNLLFPYVYDPAVYAYIMMYEVFADNNGVPGNPLVTYLNAKFIVPSPASLWLLGVGVLGLAAGRRKIQAA